ncbi:Hypothetical predicted protein, partial [Podarcis lilfordi]
LFTCSSSVAQTFRPHRGCPRVSESLAEGFSSHINHSSESSNRRRKRQQISQAIDLPKVHSNITASRYIPPCL